MKTVEIYFDDTPENVITELNKILEEKHLLKIVEVNEPIEEMPVKREYGIKIVS